MDLCILNFHSTTFLPKQVQFKLDSTTVFTLGILDCSLAAIIGFPCFLQLFGSTWTMPQWYCSSNAFFVTCEHWIHWEVVDCSFLSYRVAIPKFQTRSTRRAQTSAKATGSLMLLNCLPFGMSVSLFVTL